MAEKKAAPETPVEVPLSKSGRPLTPSQIAFRDKTRFGLTASPERRREVALKAAKAKAEKQRHYKMQGEILRMILVMDCDDEEAVAQLQSLGLDPSFANAANLAVMRRALRGDVEALRYIRDTVGEKPVDTTKLDVLTKPVEAQDLTQLSDAELELLADREKTALPPVKTAAGLPEGEDAESE